MWIMAPEFSSGPFNEGIKTVVCGAHSVSLMQHKHMIALRGSLITATQSVAIRAASCAGNGNETDAALLLDSATRAFEALSK